MIDFRLRQAGCSSLAADPSVSLTHPFQEDGGSSSRVLRECLSDFERAYLSRSLSRLFDPVNLMFASAGPTKASVHHTGTIY